jgi:hypothetical protein
MRIFDFIPQNMKTLLESRVMQYFLAHKIIAALLMVTLVAPWFVPWKNIDFSDISSFFSGKYAFSAEVDDEHSLAVILVAEDLYKIGQEKNENALTGKIFRYANDVQRTTENTKVLILPVPKTATQDQIFGVLEKFYLKGQKRGEKTFFLSGVVLVGDIPLPQVFSEVGLVESILPYTDFIAPTFLWDTDEQFWQKNSENNAPHAEILHGIITGTEQELSAFFDKNHSTRQHIESGNLPVDDAVYFSDFTKERESIMPPLLSQYEKRQKISEELVSYRYTKNLMQAVMGGFLENDVFSEPLTEEEKAYFPEGEKTIYDNMENLTAQMKESVGFSSDTDMKKTLDDFLPRYVKVSSPFEQYVKDLVEGVGRWDSHQVDSNSELISVMDEYVVGEIQKLNGKAMEDLKNSVQTMDSGVQVVLDGYVDISAFFDNFLWMNPTCELDGSCDSFSLFTNYINGKPTEELTNAKECSLARGTYLYEDQYPKTGEKKSDVGGIVLDDPLPNVASQQVEFTTLGDLTSLVSGGNPQDACFDLGGCCPVNSLNPSACVPEKAVNPVFSWSGGNRIANSTASRYSPSFPQEETSALTCQQFAISAPQDLGSSYYYRNNLKNIRGLNSVWGSIENRKKIPSLIEHAEPTRDGEKSLVHIEAQQLSLHLPSHRVPYIDLLTGDDGMKKYVKKQPENFFRYKSSLSADPARTKYELSRLVFDTNMKKIGGNSVYNRLVQPSDTPGIAQQSVALRFHRVVRFVDGKMEVGDAFAIPDDYGKTGADYESEIANSTKNVSDEQIESAILNFYTQTLQKELELNISKTDLVLFLQQEAKKYVPYSWDAKAKSIASSIQKPSQKNYAQSLENFYLHDFASDGFAEKNSALNAFLPSESEISPEKTKEKYWVWQKITPENAPSWMTDSAITKLSEQEGELFYEQFEVLAVGDDTFYSTIPVGGRSFTDLRKNADTVTSVVAALTGQNITPEKTQEVRTGDKDMKILDFSIQADGKINFSGEYGCVRKPGLLSKAEKITADDFYDKNIITNNRCGINKYFLAHTPQRNLSSKTDLVSYQTIDADAEYLHMLFSWKDFSIDQKHTEIMKLFLDSADGRIPHTPNGYSYAHLQVAGQDGIFWEGLEHEIENFDVDSLVSEDITEEKSEDDSDETDEEDENNEEDLKCGNLDGVPLHQWIGALQCWLQDIQEISFEPSQCGISYEDAPLDKSIFSESHTMLEYAESLSTAFASLHDISIFSPRGKSLLKNEPSTITISFFDPTTPDSAKENIAFTLSVSGGKLIDEDIDLDDQKEGVQAMAILGDFSFEVIPEENASEVVISVITGDEELLEEIAEEGEEERVEVEKKQKQETFFVIDSGKVVLSEVSVEQKENTLLYGYTAEVYGEGEKIDDFLEPLYLRISDTTRAYLPQEEVSAGETFYVAVRTDTPLELTASVAGYEKGKVIISANEELLREVASLQIKDFSDELDLMNTHSFEIEFLNMFGSSIDPKEVWEQYGDDFTGGAKIYNSSFIPLEGYAPKFSFLAKDQKYFLSINTQKGVGDFSGEIFWNTQAGKEIFTPFSARVGSALSKNELENFSLNALYATIIGRENTDFYLMMDLLHSSQKTNAITTQIMSPFVDKPLAIISEKGGVSLLDEKYSVGLTNLEPIRIAFSETNAGIPMAEFQFSSLASDVFLRAPQNNEKGLFVQNFSEDTGLQLQQKGNNIDFIFQGELLAEVSASGSVILHNNAFSLFPNQEPSLSDSSFFFARGETPLAEIIFRGGEWKPIGKSVAIQDALTGNGFLVFDPKRDEKVQLFSDLSTSFSQNFSGVGFKDREKFVHEYASGVSVGAATQHSADIFLINVGDPFFRITLPEKNETGFDSLLGKQILSREESDIVDTFAVDIDGDGNADVATVLQSGKILFSLFSHNRFRDVGAGVKIDAKGKVLGVFDRNNDGFEGIVYKNEKGEICFWENNGGVFTLHIAPAFFPQKKIASGAILDADNDGIKDIGLVTNDGEVLVYYGNNDRNFSDFTSVKKFEFFLPDDLSHNLHLSFEGITNLKNAKQILYPLSYFSTEKNQKELLETQKANEQESNYLPEGSLDGEKKEEIKDIENVTEDEHFVDGEEYFAPAIIFQNSFSQLSKSAEFIDPQGNISGKRVKVSIALTSIDEDKITFTLGDSYSQMLKLDKNSVQCTGCGEQYDGAVFPPQDQLIVFKNISLSKGQSARITYEAEIAKIPPLDFSFSHLNDDAFADILITGKIANKPVKEMYASTDKRSYAPFTPEKNTIAVPEEFSGYSDEDGDGVPDKFTADENQNGIPDFAEEYLSAQKNDSDNDGVPDSLDSVDDTEEEDALSDISESLDKVIDVFASCKGGGCLSMPINYAFLVPGSPNLGKVISEKVGIPTGRVANFTPLYTFGPSGTCSGKACVTLKGDPIAFSKVFPSSTFRFYLSPTITGGMGFVTCTGAGGPLALPTGKCFIQAIPQDFINEFCKDVTGDVFDSVASKVSGATSLFQVSRGSGENGSISFNLGTIDTSLPSSNNTRIKSDYFANWANKQIEEIKAMFTLPNITVYYPKMPDSLYDKTQAQKALESLKKHVNGEKEDEKKSEKTPEKNSNKNSDTKSKNTISATKNTDKNKTSTTTTVAVKDLEKTKDKLLNKAKSSINSIYDSLEPAENFVKDMQYRAKSIDDVYLLIESVPLLRVERVPIVVDVPSLSRRELLQKMREVEFWIEAAEQEVELSLQSIKDFSGANLDKPENSETPEKNPEKNTEKKEGDKNNAPKNTDKNSNTSDNKSDDKKKEIKIAAIEQAIKDAKKSIEEAKKLRNILDFYANQFPLLLVELDREVADYLYTVICYIDAITEIVGGWQKRNQKRYELWQEFFATVPAILKAFQQIPHLFTSYQSSCETCKAGNYDAGTFELVVIGKILPDPPIIRFPRLPDVVLDVSKINAAIVVKVPDIEFRARRMHMDKLPPLLLPRTPEFSGQIAIPKIPSLPTFDIPELPELPAIPLPELPDLPPAPKLPSFMADFGSLLSITEKGLYLYCLIVRKGMFVHPEAHAMSVVETLTARPLKPLKIDFLAIAPDDIILPSISKISVTAEVNLEQDFDVFTEYVQEFADEINEKTNNFIDENRLEFSPELKNLLDQSDIFDEAAEKIQGGIDSVLNKWNGEVQDFNTSLIKERNKIQGTINDKTDALQKKLDEIEAKMNSKMNEYTKSLEEGVNDSLQDAFGEDMKKLNEELQEVQKEIDTFLEENEDIEVSSVDLEFSPENIWETGILAEKSRLEAKWQANADTFVEVAEVRKSLGLPRWKPTPQKPFTGEKYQVIKDEVMAMQNVSNERSKKILATRDISSLFENGNSASSVLANTQHSQESQHSQNSTNFYSDVVSEQKSLVSHLNEDSSDVVAKLSASLPSEVETPEGIFLSTPDLKGIPLLAYTQENASIQNFFFLPSGETTQETAENNIIFSTASAVYWKQKNRSFLPKHPYTKTVEVGVFDTFIPHFQAPKNIKNVGAGLNPSVSVFPESKDIISGVVYIQDISIFADRKYFDLFQKNNPSASSEKRKYIFRLEKELYEKVAQVYPTEEFFTLEEGQKLIFSENAPPWDIREGSLVFIGKFDSMQTPFSVPPNSLATVSSQWILKDGTASNISDHILLSYIPSDDRSPPMILDELHKNAYLYTKNRIALSSLLDLEGENVEVFWDTDRDGNFETTGLSIESKVMREPSKEKIPLIVQDTQGNEVDSLVSVSYIAPSVTIDPSISSEKIGGKISPEYALAPITLLRERDGVVKKIKTFLSENSEDTDKKLQEIYLTDEDGKFSARNIDTSPNVIVRDTNGKIIGEADAKTGKLIARDKTYSVQLQEGTSEMPMRQVLVNSDNIIVANVIFSVSSQNTVQNVAAFPSQDEEFPGVYIKDVDLSDSIVAGSIPLIPVDNAGGQVIFDQQTKTPLVNVYRDGNIRFYPQSDLKINRLETPENKSLLIEVIFKNAKIFEVLLVSQNNDEMLTNSDLHDAIEIDRNRIKGGKIAYTSGLSDPRVFLSALEDEGEAVLPEKKDILFSDIDETSPYYDALKELSEKNIIIGYTDGTFRPEEKITRAEFVKIALNVTTCLDCLAPSEAEKKRFYTVNPFPDVTSNDWFDFCISKAKNTGMVLGYGDGFFRPYNSITRAEAVAILLRQSQIPLQDIPEKNLKDLSDEAWYYSEMVTAVNLGIIPENYGFVLPDEEITRGDFAKMAAKIFSFVDCHVTDTDSDGVPDYIEIFNGEDEKNVPDDFDPNNRSSLPEELANLDDPKDEERIPLPLPEESENNDGTNEEAEEGEETEKGGGSEEDEGYEEDAEYEDVVVVMIPDSDDDLCPMVPEDYDGFEDENGCPEIYSKQEKEEKQKRGEFSGDYFLQTTLTDSIIVFGGDARICGFIDYRAQVRTGDLIWAAIIKDDETEIFSESEKITVSDLFE